MITWQVQKRHCLWQNGICIYSNAGEKFLIDDSSKSDSTNSFWLGFFGQKVLCGYSVYIKEDVP